MAVEYPISVPRSPSRGQSERAKAARYRYNDEADSVERYVNREVAQYKPGTYQIAFDLIAGYTGLTYHRVAELLGGLSGGSHTVLTVVKRDLGK